MTAEQRLFICIYVGWTSGKYQRKEVNRNGIHPLIFGTDGEDVIRRVSNLSTVFGESVLRESSERSETSVSVAYHGAAALYRAAAFLRGVSHPPDCPLVDLRGIALGGGQALCY